jgi:hypothetical protein
MVFSASNPMAPFSPRISKIDRLMPTVSETEQISNRRNSPLKTRDEISDGGQCGDVPTRMLQAYALKALLHFHYHTLIATMDADGHLRNMF